MEQVLTLQSPQGHYGADACIVWCFDDRFSDLLQVFSKEFKNFDLIKIAGGAKALAGGASPDRDFVLHQIKTSVRLHDACRIVLMLHRDCGAYGGSKNFADMDVEKSDLVAKLATAKDFLAGEISGVPIDTYFADFDGLYKMEAQ
jgi:carbonic anhydrase-like protein